jgi:histidyl-tRNA synthetase
MVSTKPARGTRDFLPPDVRKRDYVIGIIKEVYESYGFEPLEGGEAFQKQIDAGDKSVEADAMLAVNEALARLGIKHFAIYISHSDVLAAILETVRVPTALQQQTIAAMRSFDKYNIEGFVAELQEVGISEKASTILADLFLKTDEILNQEHDINQTIVSNLLNIVNTETLIQLGQILQLTGRTQVLVDPALPCEPPYSLGTIVEVRTSGLETLGSGGIVDDRTLMFTFNIEQIVELIENNKTFPSEIAAPDSGAILR